MYSQMVILCYLCVLTICHFRWKPALVSHSGRRLWGASEYLWGFGVWSTLGCVVFKLLLKPLRRSIAGPSELICTNACTQRSFTVPNCWLVFLALQTFEWATLFENSLKSQHVPFDLHLWYRHIGLKENVSTCSSCAWVKVIHCVILGCQT